MVRDKVATKEMCSFIFRGYRMTTTPVLKRGGGSLETYACPREVKGVSIRTQHTFLFTVGSSDSRSASFRRVRKLSVRGRESGEERTGSESRDK